MNKGRRWAPLALVAVAVVAVVVLFVQARDPVRAQWEDRDALPSCGSVVLSQGESLRGDAPFEVACLREGLESGNGAELVVQAPTVEGDPIQSYYRVTPRGATELYEDATKDAFGDGEWHFTHCETPASVLDVSC